MPKPSLLRRLSHKSFLFSILIIIAISIYSFTPASSQSIGSTLYLPLVQSRFDNQFQWQEPVTFTPTPEISSSSIPIMIIDHRGRPHLLFDTSYSPSYIYHSFLSNNGWTALEPIAQPIGKSELKYPPFLDSNGTIHLVWNNWLGVSVENPYRLMYASFDGISWSQEEEIISGSYSYSGLPRVDEDGQPLITLVDDLLGSSIYQYGKSPSGWILRYQIKPSHPVLEYWPDNESGVRLFGTKFSTNRLISSYWKHGKLEYELTSEGESRLHSSYTQMDQNHNLHTYWSGYVPVPGGTVNGIFYQCFNERLQPGEIEYLSGTDSVVSGPAAGWDGENLFAIAWKVSGSNATVISIRRGCSEVARLTAPIVLDKDWGIVAVSINSTSGKLGLLFRERWNKSYIYLSANIQI